MQIKQGTRTGVALRPRAVGSRPVVVGLQMAWLALGLGCAAPTATRSSSAFLPVGELSGSTRMDAVSVAAPPRPWPTARMVAADAMQELVAEGERWWSQSPDPQNLAACVTCHHEPNATRGWAPSFPKVRPMPPPHTRVMTLLQANAEAVARHYRLADTLPAATALTAYLTWHGLGLPIAPGVSPGQPVFPERMRALAASVAVGHRVFAERCGRCHDAATFTPSVTAFPRMAGGRPESLEEFLEHHASASTHLSWSSPTMADLIAYLMSRIAGRPMGLGMDRGAGETRDP